MKAKLAPDSLKPLVVLFLVQLLFWSGWLLFTKYFYPEGHNPTNPFRAIARVSSILIPLLAYYRFINPNENLLSFFGLIKNARLGLITGTAISVLVILVYGTGSLTISDNLWIWVNFIIGSPLVEEMMFRVTCMHALATKYNQVITIILSAAFFALFHLPQWIFAANTLKIEAIITNLITIFIYGLIFGAIYQKTKSIYAPLLPHIINNLLTFAP